jgi:hypothetical protein
MSSSKIEQLLTPVFPEVNVSAMIRHFSGMADAFQRAHWEDSMGKGGKFVEAVLKALYARAALTPPPGPFKVDTYINGLAGSAPTSADKVIRVTIPRACRFAYDIASNRGGRHDPEEIDPNEIDANAVATNCSWILAEMIRHAQHGVKDTDSVKKIVDSLVRRRYALIEDVDGRTYFHGRRASAVDVALVILSSRYPNRLSEDDLVDLLQHHQFTKKNARTAIGRIRRFVDIDAEGRFLALTTGLEKANKILTQSRILEN